MRPMTYLLIGCLTIGPAAGWYAVKFPNCKEPTTSAIMLIRLTHTNPRASV